MKAEERQKIIDRITLNKSGLGLDLLSMIDERDKWIAAIYPLLRYAEKYPTDSGRSEFSDADEFAFQSLLEIAKERQ